MHFPNRCGKIEAKSRQDVTMYKKVLVPLDGSELAETVFTYARELAGRLGLELIFLHVCAPDERELLPMRRAYVEHAADVARCQAEELQQKAGIKAKCEMVAAQAEVAVGYPAEEILRYAEANKADLILMATHGRSGIRRWAMGSVADKVLHTSKIPVWLVRAEVPEEIVQDKLVTRRILVPLDGSKLAESVLPHVETLAKQRGIGQVEVTLLRVCKPSIISFDYAESGVPEGRKKQAEKELADCKRTSERYFARVKRRLEQSGIRVRSLVLEGEPADKIIEYAGSNQFNLIVMTSHGRSGVSRWAYGSVAGKVLPNVSSPILLVRPSKPGRDELEKYKTTVKLRDGSLMRLRPIKPGDDKKLLSLFYRLSPDTVFLRFHHALTQMSKKEIRRLCTVDYDDSFALVATAGEGRKERIVGIMRYFRLPPGDMAETSIVVEDSYQGKGIGSHLIKQIAAIAREKGVHRLQGEVLPDNQGVMKLLKASGFKMGRELDSGVYRVILHIG